MNPPVFPVFLLFSLVIPSLSQAASMELAVTPLEPNQFQISVHTVVAASQPAVWRVLTDYDHHAGILPYMTQSRIVETRSRLQAVGSNKPQPQLPEAKSLEPRAFLIVEQEGTIRVLFWTFTMRVTQEVAETAPEEMRFKAIEGDFRQLEGTWRLAPEGKSTRLECLFVLQPKRKVPEWAVRFAARRYLTKMVESLQRHAERS